MSFAHLGPAHGPRNCRGHDKEDDKQSGMSCLCVFLLAFGVLVVSTFIISIFTGASRFFVYF